MLVNTLIFLLFLFGTAAGISGAISIAKSVSKLRKLRPLTWSEHMLLAAVIGVGGCCAVILGLLLYGSIGNLFWK